MTKRFDQRQKAKESEVRERNGAVARTSFDHSEVTLSFLFWAKEREDKGNARAKRTKTGEQREQQCGHFFFSL